MSAKVTGETITRQQICDVLGYALDGARPLTARIAQVALGTWHGCHRFAAMDGRFEGSHFCGVRREDGEQCGRMASDDAVHIDAARTTIAACYCRIHEVTGETITEAQIRQLWDTAVAQRDMRIATDCSGALSSRSPATRGLLRERCAAAYNRLFAKDPTHG